MKHSRCGVEAEKWPMPVRGTPILEQIRSLEERRWPKKSYFDVYYCSICDKVFWRRTENPYAKKAKVKA